jgi:NAD(P)H-dependent FMN reductase
MYGLYGYSFMTTIICGTNRQDALTHVVFRKIADIHSQVFKGEPQHLIDMHEVEFSLDGHQYESAGQSEALRAVQDNIMVPSERLIFVIPEYNGSFPGVLKTFIDALSIRKYNETFSGKKVLLVGCATGRAGNLRGLDHFTEIMMHMGSFVYPRRLPISGLGRLVEDNELRDRPTLDAIIKVMNDFVLF